MELKSSLLPHLPPKFKPVLSHFFLLPLRRQTCAHALFPLLFTTNAHIHTCTYMRKCKCCCEFKYTSLCRFLCCYVISRLIGGADAERASKRKLQIARFFKHSSKKLFISLLLSAVMYVHICLYVCTYV